MLHILFARRYRRFCLFILIPLVFFLILVLTFLPDKLDILDPAHKSVQKAEPLNGEIFESQIDDSHIELEARTQVPIFRDGGLLGKQIGVHLFCLFIRTFFESGNFEPPKSIRKSRVHRPGDYGKKFSMENLDVDPNEVSAKKNEYGMNIVASDHIPMDRIVPDLRHEECRHWDYPEQLPSASVVIVFYNEGFTTLLRTVHSVLIRSPRRFLREVLLVDDFSDKENLHGINE